MKRLGLLHILGFLAASIVASGGACGGKAGDSVGSETNWLAVCRTDTDCSIGSCVCGICTLRCDDDTSCSDGPPQSTCATADSAAIIALCGDAPPVASCLPECADSNDCAMAGSCVAGHCVPSDGSGGAGGNGGAGGSGGTALNTCPPTLIHSGAAPGILCDDSGVSCSDSEQFCECGEPTFEGSAWSCVPSAAGCPETVPGDSTACDATQLPCDYVQDGVRLSCTCDGEVFSCASDRCNIQRPLTGELCTGDAGLVCSYFVAATPTRPDDSGNVTCTCGSDATWTCDDGCPASFPGADSSFDSEGPINCSWRTSEGFFYCGCDSSESTWNCITMAD
jgi:hypothetical protein